MNALSTQNVYDGSRALVGALDIARGSLAEGLHARVGQDGVVLTVPDAAQAKDLAWHFGATHEVTLGRYAYSARKPGQRRHAVLIEVEGRPQLAPRAAGSRR
ncbi:hypothetical protein [Cellulomonas olei]|uniref:hypothetical protein n=1 Tax=Cellulomonas sp. P4 TaxID=3142533 RepID=UPI0031BB8C69